MLKGIIIAAVLLISACSSNNRITNGQLIGAIGGGVIGGYAGTQLGGGSGNLLFIVAGTTLGSLVGYAYGDSLVPSDRAMFKKSAKVAMDNIKDGNVYSWVNPDTGVAGTITPIKSYYAENNKICRDFDATIAVEKRVGLTKGRACKIGMDAWMVDSRI